MEPQSLESLQPISRPMHGILTDYPYVATVSTAPTLFGFEDEKAAVAACQVFSGTILVSSILTRAEWGFVRVIPYKAHLALDFMGGLAALAAPWVLGFSHNERARNTFIGMGIFGVLAGTLSRPEEMP